MAIPLHLVRLAVLVTATLFAIIPMGIGAALAAASDPFPVPAYAALAIASGVLTLVTVPAMICLEIMRPGGPTSMVIVEIFWLGILSILWLATGAETAAVLQAVDDISLSFGFGSLCGADDGFSNGFCSEARAVAAFSFLNWLLLMCYVVTLFFYSLMASSRKQTGVWTSSVANAQSAGPSQGGPVPNSYVSSGHPHQDIGTGGTVQAGTVHV
ncbi:hypothetical protein GGX14DRAFT_562910 [Mycena pura]|uniref:MARVEL domain-containing protein n=1 Tax=Mycena pura TaxID=153505 RepID=A0AAD6VJF2_9AGAR|nr:hypothetical protein GGX14DRAFT_562910 [Mycena pura]